MEPFGITMRRQLHENHPLHRLLKPHFKGTIFINRQALDVLIAEEGSVDKTLLAPIVQMAPVINAKIETVRFNDLFLKTNLADRGVMSDKLYYPYREDALPLWDAVNVWVASVVNEFYTDDSAVVSDKELQAFAVEISSDPIGLKGFGDDAYLADRRQPVLSTKMYLIEMLTMVIFTTSCQHSALNFAQKPYLSYVPSFPLSMQRPDLPGTGNDEATWESWRQWFPSLADCNQQWSVNQLLGSLKYTSLGEYPSEVTSGHPTLRTSLTAFQNKLKEIGEKINKREAGAKVKYLVLHPNQIPASINI
jgi:arachidonate 15-lipoxygenase